MKKIAQVYRLKPGKKEEYIKAHREIWPEMLALLKQAGCREMTIFLRRDMLFMVAEVDDPDTFNQVVNASPVNKRWQAWMADLLERPFDDEEAGIFADLKEVWHFDAYGV